MACRIWPDIVSVPSTLGAQSLNHWTTREVQHWLFFFSFVIHHLAFFFHCHSPLAFFFIFVATLTFEKQKTVQTNNTQRTPPLAYPELQTPNYLVDSYSLLTCFPIPLSPPKHKKTYWSFQPERVGSRAKCTSVHMCTCSLGWHLLPISIVANSVFLATDEERIPTLMRFQLSESFILIT